jgi:CheY-like chemotaxis protein
VTQIALKLLVVEDEALIAMVAEDLLDVLGHQVIAIAATLADAHVACDSAGFDAALLDVHLNGHSSMELATKLKARGIPFAFTTGYGAGGIDACHADMPVLTKPYALAELEAVLTKFAIQLAGTSSMTSSVDSNLG